MISIRAMVVSGVLGLSLLGASTPAEARWKLGIKATGSVDGKVEAFSNDKKVFNKAGRVSSETRVGLEGDSSGLSLKKFKQSVKAAFKR